jgi:hypothetical protein
MRDDVKVASGAGMSHLDNQDTLTVYEPNQGRGGLVWSLRQALHDLVTSRHVIARLFWRDFISQFRQKILSYFWDVLSPVLGIIVVVEWNSVFGPDHAVSVPYDPNFERSKAHYSNLFWGASISAFGHLGAQKGFSLVGSNAVGNNIFFVRNDRLGRVKPLSTREAWVDSRFRDSRDKNGQLNFLGGASRRLEILDVPLIDVIGGKQTTLRSLDEATPQPGSPDNGTPNR